MPAKQGQIYDRLCECNEAQLAYIEEHLQLESKFLATAAIASRARGILKLLRTRPDKGWINAIWQLLDKVQGDTESYLGNRLAPLKDFLVESRVASNASPESVGTIKDLREKLAEVGQLKLQKPLLIKVRGTLFPAALLTAGWWERKKTEKTLSIEWKNPLQKWLFEGFDLWAPSWDICWGAADPRDHSDSKRYYIAQLTEGDEADSLPVIIGTERAKRLSDEFRDSWGGFEVVVVGRLGNRSQFEKRLPRNVKRDPLDYYISLEDDNPRHKITRLTAKTELYSGYLWKLLAPEEWIKADEMPGLNRVYFVWEHTNFVAKQAVDYNLAGLDHKERLISDLHRGSRLVLLQKSHEVVPGKPAWPIEKFYQFYLMQGKEV